MAVRIRLRRMGRKKQPHYRIVVAEGEFPRDGRIVENLGYYKPLSDPARLVVDLERAEFWIGRGAAPSGTVKSLLGKARKGGDDGLVVGAEDVEARKQAEAEALAGRRSAEKKAQQEAAQAEKAAKAEAAAAATRTAAEARAETEDAVDAAEGKMPGVEAEPAEAKGEGEPAGSATDETKAEALAKSGDEAVADAEDSEPNAPPKTGKTSAASKRGGAKKDATEVEDKVAKTKAVEGASGEEDGGGVEADAEGKGEEA